MSRIPSSSKRAEGPEPRADGRPPEGGRRAIPSQIEIVVRWGDAVLDVAHVHRGSWFFGERRVVERGRFVGGPLHWGEVATLDDGALSICLRRTWRPRRPRRPTSFALLAPFVVASLLPVAWNRAPSSSPEEALALLERARLVGSMLAEPEPTPPSWFPPEVLCVPANGDPSMGDTEDDGRQQGAPAHATGRGAHDRTAERTVDGGSTVAGLLAGLATASASPFTAEGLSLDQSAEWWGAGPELGEPIDGEPRLHRGGRGGGGTGEGTIGLGSTTSVGGSRYGWRRNRCVETMLGCRARRPRPPSVRITGVHTEGARSRAPVRRTLRRGLRAMTDCYDRGRERHPMLRGELDVRFVIMPGGSVLGASAIRSTIDATTRECLLDTVRETSHRPAIGPATRVKLQIHLVPSTRVARELSE